MLHAKAKAAALLCAGMALSACTTVGTGTGADSPGNAPVQFAWRSTDGGTTGTRDARSTDFHPLWNGRDYGWSDWGPEPFPNEELKGGRAVDTVFPRA